jgi:hypothetical protein
MKFQSSSAGQIVGIRYYRAPNESGAHTGTIWSTAGSILAQASFANETSSGWQMALLSAPLSIQANTVYIVSVNVNGYYVDALGGLASSVINGPLSSVADGANGVFNIVGGSFPDQSYQNSNYFRDIVFLPSGD